MKILSILVLSCALVACGGGGGGSTDTSAPAAAAPAQLSVLNAWKSLMGIGGTWSTSGKGSDGATYDITTAIVPKGVASLNNPKDISGMEPKGTVFPRTNFNAVEVTTTTRKGGVFAGTDTKLIYLDQATSAIAYMIAPDLPSCIPPGSVGQVPGTSALNTSGFLFTGYDNAYSNSICYSNPFAVYGTTYRLTWSYESEIGLPLFCLNYTTTTWGKANSTLQSSCFETTALGVIGAKARLSVTSGAFSLISKNY